MKLCTICTASSSKEEALTEALSGCIVGKLWLLEAADGLAKQRRGLGKEVGAILVIDEPRGGGARSSPSPERFRLRLPMRSLTARKGGERVTLLRREEPVEGEDERVEVEEAEARELRVERGGQVLGGAARERSARERVALAHADGGRVGREREAVEGSELGRCEDGVGLERTEQLREEPSGGREANGQRQDDHEVSETDFTVLKRKETT